MIVAKRKKFLIIGALLLTMLVSFFPHQLFASTSKRATITLKVTKQGIPSVNNQILGENLTIAYDKIKNGNFSKADISSAIWKNFKQQYKVTGNVISLASSLTIGPGEKLSKEKTLEALQIIYKQDIRFLEQINGASFGVTGGTTSNSAQFVFHYPGNAGRLYTNNQGKAQATVALGYYALLNSDGTLIKMIKVSKDVIENIDLSNEAVSGISATIDNLPETSKNNVGQYVVEFGRKVTYKVRVSKALLKTDATITINPNTNLVIDKISVPYTVNNLLPSQINAANYGVTTADQKSAFVTNAAKKKISAFLYNASIESYLFTIPARKTDATVFITAHLNPQINLSVSAINISTNDNPTDLSLKIGESGGEVLKPYSLSLNYSNKSKTMVYQSADSIISGGINFVVGNSSHNTLVDRYKYVLGKKIGTKYYLYLPDGTWKKVSSNFKNENLSQYQVIGGDRRYIIDDADSTVIPLTTSRNNYNYKKQTKTNQSVFQLTGLGAGVDYFLYQTQPTPGYDHDSSLHYFKVYSDQRISPNGSVVQQNSMGNAQKENDSINSLLPAFSAGTKEYNFLNMNSGKKAVSNPSIRIIASIIAVVVILFIAMVVILKLT